MKNETNKRPVAKVPLCQLNYFSTDLQPLSFGAGAVGEQAGPSPLTSLETGDHSGPERRRSTTVWVLPPPSPLYRVYQRDEGPEPSGFSSFTTVQRRLKAGPCCSPHSAGR